MELEAIVGALPPQRGDAVDALKDDEGHDGEPRRVGADDDGYAHPHHTQREEKRFSMRSVGTGLFTHTTRNDGAGRLSMRSVGRNAMDTCLLPSIRCLTSEINFRRGP